MVEPVIRIVDLWKDFRMDGTEVPALRGINIEIKKARSQPSSEKAGRERALFSIDCRARPPYEGPD